MFRTPLRAQAPSLRVFGDPKNFLRSLCRCSYSNFKKLNLMDIGLPFESICTVSWALASVMGWGASVGPCMSLTTGPTPDVAFGQVLGLHRLSYRFTVRICMSLQCILKSLFLICVLLMFITYEIALNIYFVFRKCKINKCTPYEFYYFSCC